MQRAYSEAGLTSVIDRSQSAAGFRAYQDLWQKGQLLVRTSVTRRVNAERPVEEVLQEIEGIGAVTGHGDEMFRVGSLKVVLDGGILLGTAYMRAPYGQNTQVYGFEDADYRGELRIRPGDLEQIVALAADLGWQMTAHTTGGGSTDLLLAAYEAVNRKVPIADRRFTLTHANFLSGDAIAKGSRVGRRGGHAACLVPLRRAGLGQGARARSHGYVAALSLDHRRGCRRLPAVRIT